ncbi:DUF4179 domain-containing protein [Sediminibacillus massiliensis]|uniref:DUF4179 domain-containing protein n=1 Tax=Sediminibacillus massiliensis TaxID=1926277 RepID=UPI0009884BD6|nr:DUF4179 domain-containing protein [Sediminibacillus massiliensis]
MTKDYFQEEYEKVDVPKEDVIHAIRKGRQRANKAGIEGKRRKSFKSSYLAVTAAAGILITSSFAAPTFSKAMTDLPVIGSIYDSFNDLVGRDLESEQLITALDKTASSRGIDVTVKSAYYDGAVIGVTFDVEGNVKPEQNGELQGFYQIFEGDESLGETKEIVHMKPVENGFTGHVQLHYPKSDLPADTTFPLEFLTIGGKEGDWKFDVPIEQLPYETVEVEKESTGENTDVKVRFDSIVKGQASTTINYTAIFPETGKHNQVRLDMATSKGEEIHQVIGGIDLGLKTENGKGLAEERTIILQPLEEETEFIEIQPKVALAEPDQFVELDEPTPAKIASDKQDLSITVERIAIKKGQAVFDFQINEGDNKGRRFGFFQDIARTDVTLVEKSEKDIYQEPMEHSIKVLDKEDLRFRSTFQTSEVSGFKQEDYVLRVSLGGMSSNIPLELEKVRIKMD